MSRVLRCPAGRNIYSLWWISCKNMLRHDEVAPVLSQSIGLSRSFPALSLDYSALEGSRTVSASDKWSAYLDQF